MAGLREVPSEDTLGPHVGGNAGSANFELQGMIAEPRKRRILLPGRKDKGGTRDSDAAPRDGTRGTLGVLLARSLSHWLLYMCVLYEYCCVIVEALLSETYMYKGTRGTLGKTQASLLLTGTREDDLMSLHQNRVDVVGPALSPRPRLGQVQSDLGPQY